MAGANPIRKIGKKIRSLAAEEEEMNSGYTIAEVTGQGIQLPTTFKDDEPRRVTPPKCLLI